VSDLLDWLREELTSFSPRAVAILLNSDQASWPLSASSQDELLRELDNRKALAPLPTESAALANVIEVSILEFLRRRLADLREAGYDVRDATAGARAYPDLEVGGSHFGGEVDRYEAVDIKVARRNRAKTQTQSRITLYTGNTYFKYQDLHLPGILRPFNDYTRHLDVLVIYDFVPDRFERIEDVEIIVHESWRIASRQRSSTTREYIGAVQKLDDLRSGSGEFTSREDFYAYWHRYKFKTSDQVMNHLARIARQAKPSE
jgi:hypothetical protein